jgi:hypothetical protein
MMNQTLGDELEMWNTYVCMWKQLATVHLNGGQ